LLLRQFSITHVQVMASSLKNIVVVGASYVGRVSLRTPLNQNVDHHTDRTAMQGAALELARNVPATHRVS